MLETSQATLPQNDHDLLIGLVKDMCWLKKIMGNHLRHHWATELTLLTMVGGLITAVVVVWLRH